MRKLFSLHLAKQTLIIRVICLSMFLGLALIPRAQTIDFAACGTTVTLPPKTAGVNVGSMSITATNTPYGAAVSSMDILKVTYLDELNFETRHCDDLDLGITPCNSPVTIFSLTINITGGTGTITGTPTGTAGNPVAGKTIVFTIKAITTSGVECTCTFNLPIIRKPIDLAIVLDKSGSMGWSFDGTNYSPGANNRRWDGLVTGVGVMVSALNSTTIFTNDKIGICYFETTAFTPPSPSVFHSGLVAMKANIANVTTEVSSRGPGTSTALGNGIITGKGLLLPGTTGNKKAMIVFSDGMQNEGDQVKTSGVGAYTQTDLGVDLNGPSDEITIHTIALGTSGANPSLMQSIAQNNGNGEYFNSIANDRAAFLNNSFLGTMQTVLNGSSPQFVDIREGQFSGSGTGGMTAIETFVVNKTVSSVFVAMSAANRLEARFQSIMKDGVNLIQYIHQSSGPGYRTFYVNFPILSLPAMKPDGEWKINMISGSASGITPAYAVSMIVDDHVHHLDFSAGNAILKVGESLSPVVSLMSGDQPVTTASVQGIILKPGEDINDLIARSTVQFNAPDSDKASPDVYKLAELLKDSAFVAKIKSLNRLINFTYQPAQKNYSASFSELDVAGVYRIIYHVSVSNATVGVLKRFFQKSFNVRFKDIDLAKSNVVITTDSATGNSIISCRFISSTGKYIGPGWGSTIGIDAPGLKIDRVEDLGDGTYKLHLNGKLSGSGKLTLFTETFFDGKFSDLGKGGGGFFNEIWKQWWFWIVLLVIIIVLFLLFRKK